MMDLKFNKYQSSLEELNINQYPEEVQEQFYDFVNNVPYIKNLVSPNRRVSKDMPKDDQGKIIVDLENPHIIEDMDYFRPTALHFQKTGRMTDLRPNANPNSEFGKWIREEIRRCWYGYVREDDGEWVSGDMYYYLNYCPIQQIEGDAVRVRRIIDMPRIWEGQYLVTHYLNKARESGMFAAELASRGKGKALPLTNFVPTPNGWKFWGDIQVGDFLWDEKGNPTKVIDIPYYGPIDVLRIGLSDGREIFCSAEHEFEITYYQTKQIRDADWIGRNYHKTRNKGPKNPTGDEYVITLPIGDCVQFKEKQVPIDAYTLGLMLGDGCFRTPSNKHSVRFTGGVNDVDFYKTQVPYKIYRHPKYNTENSIKKSNIVKELKELELWGKNSHNKFIPEIYKYNSENIRLSLLQGLVDTDGWINGRTQCYCTTSETMKDDVLEVARSLGIKSYSFKKKDAWTISFQTDRILCRLPRKVSKIKKPTQRYIKTSKRVTVINVSYVTRCIGKCVTVSNESGLFLANDYIVTHNSYLGASLLAKRFNLGEDEYVSQKVQSVVTASLEKYIHGANQILDMFKYYIDFTAEYTEFPRRRLTDSFQSLTWESGYKDTATGVRKGSQNAVIGITSNSDSSKLIGSRGVLYIIEEMGKFPGLRSMWDLIKPCVSDGKKAWGLIFSYGTAGEDESDFTSAKELLYNPLGYNIYAIKNVYDKQGLGRDKFAFFFPAYMNRAGCYDKNGISDVTKALIEILMERYVKKYNSSDINSITTLIAQNPITPQEAIMKVKDNFFPVTQINERINQLDSDTSSFDDVYVGDFAMDKDGKVTFVSTQQQPIREFPLDEKTPNKEGAVELYELPQKINGEVPSGRYIISVDPYDKDQADTTSLYSMFIFDLFTDRVVGEYTGRPSFVQTAYERTRLAALFYNARVGYENNIMGLFQYFTEKRCIHLLLETPEFLYDKQIIKIRGVGNAKYGIRATVPINNLGNDLIKQWLMQTTVVEREIDGQVQQIEIPNLYVLKNRALLQECAFYNPVINVDRIRSFGILMIYRQSMIIVYGGDVKSQYEQYDKDDPANDEFFVKNYHPKNAYYRKKDWD